MSGRRVVITGLGMVTPLGQGVEETVEAMVAGRGAVRAMAEWKGYAGLRSLVAAPAELMNEKDIPRKSRRSMSRMSLFALQAARQAGAGLDAGLVGGGEVGCVIGSTMGSAIAINETFESMLPEKDLSNMTAMRFFQCVSHTAVMNVAQTLGITGMVMAPSAACASGLQAVGLGYDLIRLGRQTAMFCGGAEELHPTVTGSFDVLFATSTRYNDDPAKTPRPFDADRDGLVCGEGSGVLLLEEYAHARRRGAVIWGEILGFHTCGSGEHVSQSSREAMTRCMTVALRDAGVAADAVDYVGAHATGTIHGDVEEARALAGLLGGGVPVSSFKGHMGHTLGASGAIELGASLFLMNRGLLIPTLNLERIDPECAGVDHVVETREAEVKVLLKNSFAFGGINAAVVCRKVEG